MASAMPSAIASGEGRWRKIGSFWRQFPLCPNESSTGSRTQFCSYGSPPVALPMLLMLPMLPSSPTYDYHNYYQQPPHPPPLMMPYQQIAMSPPTPAAEEPQVSAAPDTPASMRSGPDAGRPKRAVAAVARKKAAADCMDLARSERLHDDDNEALRSCAEKRCALPCFVPHLAAPPQHLRAAASSRLSEGASAATSTSTTATATAATSTSTWRWLPLQRPSTTATAMTSATVSDPVQVARDDPEHVEPAEPEPVAPPEPQSVETAAENPKTAKPRKHWLRSTAPRPRTLSAQSLRCVTLWPLRLASS